MNTHPPATLAVVVTYNRKELLLECLEALSTQRGADCDILVIDNAGTDGTWEMLCAREDAACLEDTADLTLPQTRQKIAAVRLSENKGGAGGFARGMALGVSAGYGQVWIMDDDTIPRDNALVHLEQAAERAGDFGFLSSDVRWTDGSPCRMNHQQLLEKLPSPKGMKRVASATFVSLLIPSAVIRKLGLPFEEYFIWGDDKEYTLRLSDALPCYFVPKSRVIHKTAVNAGSSIASDDAARVGRYFYAYRNDLVTARRRGVKDVLVYHAAFALNTLRVAFKSRDAKRERLEAMHKGRAAAKDFEPRLRYPD